MFIQIITNAPVWIWPLLLGLIALGYTQTFSRRMSLRKVVIMPVAMMVFSILGTVSAFGMSLTSILPWIIALMGATALLGLRERPNGSFYDNHARVFRVSGSWVPMVLILAIFFTKFAVGVSLAIRPNLRLDPTFISTFSMLYGLFSGVFTGRAVRLIRLVNAPGKQTNLKAQFT
jgi:hypothetical protein